MHVILDISYILDYIQNKFVKGLPKRILTTLINMYFSIAVFVFALTGWTYVGSNEWTVTLYVFDIASSNEKSLEILEYQ